MFKISKNYYFARSTVLCLSVFIFLCSCSADLIIKDIHTAPSADLIIKDIHTEPLTNTTLWMKGTVKNRGSKKAGKSTTSLELKNNWASPYTQPYMFPTSSLDAGEEEVVSLGAYSPSNELQISGDCRCVRVCADANSDVYEMGPPLGFIPGSFWEGNNCRTESFGNNMNNTFSPRCDLCCQESLPSSFDWTNWKGKNWITPVKDQGYCGSCWAFSAAAVVEAKKNVEGLSYINLSGLVLISHLDLSEEELVSCTTLGSCNGGGTTDALHYIRDTGIVEELTLPYLSPIMRIITPKNHIKCNTIPASADRWEVASVVFREGSVDDLKRRLLCHGPVSASSTNWEHAILIVGWYDSVFPSSVTSILGWSSGGWIIKNSWGTGWGSNGYGIIPFSGHQYSDIRNSTRYVQGINER